MFVNANASGTSPFSFNIYSGNVSVTVPETLCRAAAMILFMTFPVMPAFFNFSVDGYTPVIVPAGSGWLETTSSTSGCTMLIHPL